MKWCLKQYYNEKNSQKWLSKYLGITPRRFRQIYSEYRRKGEIPLIGKDIGRPNKKVPKEWEEIVISEWSKDKLNALYLEKTIYYRHKIRIPHNTIHKIMLKNGLVKEEDNKKKRRKPWIRYERKHSLSAVHLDWHGSKIVPGKQVCVVLDDASRKVLSGGEFDNATAENSVNLLVEAVKEYPPIYNVRVRESITDHGAQFYSEKRDKKGKANHPYENLLEKEGITDTLWN